MNKNLFNSFRDFVKSSFEQDLPVSYGTHLGLVATVTSLFDASGITVEQCRAFRAIPGLRPDCIKVDPGNGDEHVPTFILRPARYLL